MRVYIIGNDGITLCRRAPATLNDGEIAVASNEELRAAPLSAKHHDRLQAALSTLFSHDVQLNVDVDPTVVGGVRVEVGDEVVDGSLQRRLEEAQRRLAG